MYLTIGSIIIDDIVLPDGRTRMGTLGGGMTHAAMGMRVWVDDVRALSTIGPDFPPELRQQLARYFDLQAVLERPQPTPRAWQLFETSGHRTEIFRTSFADFLATCPFPHEIPVELLAVKGAHMQPVDDEAMVGWVARLRKAGCPFIILEPWPGISERADFGRFQPLARMVDCVSPNLEEGQEMTGRHEPLDVLHSLLDGGAPLAVLRMGAEGSLIADRRSCRLLKVPAVSVPAIIDVTGAGNAYCGGFAVGLGETGDLEQAARYAAVSGSLALEQFGAVIPLEGLRDRARERLAQVQVEELAWPAGWN